MSLNVGLWDYSNRLSRLSLGYDTILVTNAVSTTTWPYVSNLFTETVKNVYYYFSAHGDTSLFNFLVAGEYLKWCNYSRINGTDWWYSFTVDGSLTSSVANSIANKTILKGTTVSNGSSVWGADGEIPSVSTNYAHRLRIDIRVPQTVARDTVGGSIDVIYLYTYTT